VKRIIKVGNVAIPIYRTMVRRDGKQWEAWTVSFSISGVRHRITRADYAEAKSIAETKATQIGSGHALVAGMSSQDAASWARAVELLPAGKTLEVAMAEYAAACRDLGTTTISEAVTFYRERHQAVTDRSIADAITEMLVEKQQDGLSVLWIRQLTNILARFSAAFTGSLSTLRGPMLNDWLRATFKANKTRNNARICLTTLVSFSKGKGYLPRDWAEMDAVSIAKASSNPILIYTPGEFSALLAAATERLLPVLLFGGLAGLRSAEIERLDWADVRANHVVVTAQAAKTGARRIVPLCDTLAAMLKPLRRPAGMVLDTQDTGSELPKWSKAHGLLWKKNALRHSYISYRLSQVSNAAQVAMEAGNSAKMIFQHYRELVTSEQADEWFNVRIPS
jgi:integrase